ncbi:ATP-binding protein [Oscillibacter sp.]|uniref:ATP-binding protein n=1 Tax=Oscillibacter sp. TaxID=1945593 RepID=UPI002898E962|nr:ATP-binding protein [Oscillibacter sp.]
MGLADYQQDIVAQMYQLLIENDCNKGIGLYGATGSGKSTIALNLAAQLQEGWSTFYIRGIDPNLSPYLTWHIGTKLYSKTKLSFEGNISFGIDFFPLPLSFGGGITIQKDKKNYILTPSEEALIACIKKQAEANKHIFLIVDDYELWDIPSKQFLQKITLSKLTLLSEFHVVILLISREKSSIEGEFMWKYIPVNEITDNDVLFVLRQKEYAGFYNINDIRRCAGNNLSLALIAAEYYNHNGISGTNFNELMDNRCRQLSEQEIDAFSALAPLSIIDSYFTKDETAFFINQSPEDEEDIAYQAENYLLLAKKLLFIEGDRGYKFTTHEMKNYFKLQISKKEKLLHRKFSNFLRKRHSEDYFSRGKHLSQSLMNNDIEAIREAWQLLFLSYIRRVSETDSEADTYNILSEIEVLLTGLSIELADMQRSTLKEFLDGYQLFSQYRYKDALLHLQALMSSQLSLACLAESQRLILLCHLQLAENPNAIKRTAEELYDTIESYNFDEDEQYCRASLVLLNVYTDRFYDAPKLKTLKSKLIQIIHRHPGTPAFAEFDACYNRKAALYFSALFAFQQTEQSVKYYRNRYNRSGLYMALCNHAGNAMIVEKYDNAQQSLSECAEIANSSNGLYYPSQYKVENNQVLLTYLQEDKLALENESSDMISSAACKTSMELARIVEHQQDEVSHVILLNYLGLSILCGSKSWPLELKKVNLQLADADEYYQFYLHDLNFASALLQHDLIRAQAEVDILKKLDPPLLREYKAIIFKRRCVQQELLSSPSIKNIDPVEYHRFISKECAHIQDPSCHFFGRGFLLSDLQFLSF